MKLFYCNGKKDFCHDYNNNLCIFCDFADGTEGYEIEVPDNPYWQHITALAEKQRAKGMHKYGQGLEANTADILARINHLQEELIDGLMYCEWIKEWVQENLKNAEQG